MTSAKFRLGLAVTLFAVWMGWLIRLAFTSGRPIVLSRPQFLISSLDVVAHIKGLKEPIEIREVLWPQTGQQKWTNKESAVANLPECDGWVSEGNYIVPLVAGPGDTLQVAPIPPSAGWRERASLPARIYRDTPETRGQALEVIAGKNPKAS